MLLDAISKAGTIALGGHVRPDGDCAGSCMGLYNYVRENFPEKEIDVYLEELPNTLKFMKNTDKIRHEVTEEKTYDLFIALDCGDMGRLGFSAVLFKKAAVRFCVDHHVSNQSFADQNYIMPDASSTSELIYDLLDYGKMSVETAECLYTGISTDTGCFRFENTTPRCHEIVAKLMGYGIPYAKINRELFEIKSRARLTVEQHVINSMEMYLDDKCAVIAVTSDMIAETGLAPEEFEGLASIPMQVEGVEVGVTIKEKEPGKFKVSMRSAESVNVSELCAKLGGGGHIRAAGCTVEGNLSQVKLKILSVIAPALGFDLWLS